MFQEPISSFERGKESFLFQKATNILMKSGKQDKALFILNNCFALINELQQKKKSNGYTVHLYPNTLNSIKPLGFYVLLMKQLDTNVSKSTEDFKFSDSNSMKNSVLSAFDIIEQAINNVGPFLEVRKVKTARNTKQVPAMINKRRQQTLGIRWIVEAAQQRKKNSSQSLSKCLAVEFLEAYAKQGKARQKRNEMHKMAYANRAHLRSRWW